MKGHICIQPYNPVTVPLNYLLCLSEVSDRDHNQHDLFESNILYMLRNQISPIQIAVKFS